MRRFHRAGMDDHEQLDVELAEIAATEARLYARARGMEVPAEAYVRTDAEIERSVELARTAPPPPPGVVRIDPATLPQPMSEEQVEAELHRQEEHRDLLQVLTPSGKLKTYRMRNERFHRVPPRRRQGDDGVSVMPRRQATTSRRRPSNRARRVVASRDGPSEPSDDPLAYFRPVQGPTAV